MLFHGVQDVQHFNDLKKILNYDTRPFNPYNRDVGLLAWRRDK